MVATIFKRIALAALVAGTLLSVGCGDDDKDQPAAAPATRQAFDKCMTRLQVYSREYSCYQVRTYSTCSLDQWINRQCYSVPYTAYPPANLDWTALLNSYFNIYLTQYATAYDRDEMIRLWNSAY